MKTRESWSSKAMNLETKKLHTKRIKIHQTQWPFGPVGVKFCFQRGLLRWLTVGKNTRTVKVQKAPSLQILIDVAEKPKIQRRFWHRRSCVIWNSCKQPWPPFGYPNESSPLLSPLKQPSSIWYTWRKIQSEKEGEHDNRLSTSHTAPVTYLFQNKVVFVLKIMQIFKVIP